MEVKCSNVTQCKCLSENHLTKKIVITGGPGAGKTAVLEIARNKFCEHVIILPESASILFGGGFPRKENVVGKKASQRAIFHIQHELEHVYESHHTAITLCDRGTIDGLAYWPDDEASYWKELGTSKQIELNNYDVVVHLRSPSMDQGYNHQNPVRIESAVQAAEIDKRIEKAWNGHKNRIFISSENDFLTKVESALNIIKSYLPNCCSSVDKDSH